LNSFDEIERQIKLETVKYDSLSYKIEKTIEEMRIDIRILKNELAEAETVRKVLLFSNTLLQSSIKESIRQSFE
jgi:hypothetical protein